MLLMKKLLYGFLCSLFLFSGNIFAETWISVPDVIAGNSNQVRVSGLYANEKISVKLIRPNKTKIDLQAISNEFGISSFKLSPINIQQAGHYNIIISRDFENTPSVKNFTVYPGPVSAYKSEIIIDKPSVEADGEQTSRIKIIAKDAFGNIIKNIPVKVISSRNFDFIISDKKTDSQGQAQAKITSKAAGVSTISVILGDTVLFNKPEIVFFTVSKELKSTGAGGWNIGKFLKAQLFDDPTEATNVAYFSIEDLPSEASKGENLTAKIVAKDENGQTVVNYTGTIRFSSSDDRAILPNDYTFSPDDQGEHSFYLAITFGTSGEQTLAVHDLDDFRISGEQSVNIAADTTPIETTDNPKLTIDIPTNNSSFNTSRITISGISIQCGVVKLVDGQITLIDNLAVDDSNKYVYQTPSLADGTHIFQAICMDQENLTSNKVTINIDRTPPQVISVETTPAGPFCGNEDARIKVGGEELDSVSCIFNEQIITLSKTESGNFEAPIKIPAKKGDYPVECTVSDSLGNSVTEPNASVISTDPKNCAPEKPVEDNNSNNEENDNIPQNIPPTAVLNLSAKSGEKEKVTLFWSPATDDKAIKNYKINFAECSQKDNLNQENQTPDDRTQWYVTPLKPCVKYCFKVIAIDEEGLKSPASNMAEGTPFCPQQNIHPTAPKSTPTSGGSSLWASIIAIIAGFIMIIISRLRES